MLIPVFSPSDIYNNSTVGIPRIPFSAKQDGFVKQPAPPFPLLKPGRPHPVLDGLVTAANVLDKTVVPSVLTPVLRLAGKRVTRHELGDTLRSKPYSLSNIAFRMRYPRRYGVQVYGSARPTPDGPLAHWYELGVTTGERLVKAGLFPVTGGGPGMMKAVAEGGKMGEGHTVGVALPLIGEGLGSKQKATDMYQELVRTNTFAHRLKGPGGFYHRAGRVLILPGGLGTKRELLEALEEQHYSDQLSHFPVQKQVVLLDDKQFFSKTFKPYVDSLIAEKLVSPSVYDRLKLVNNLDDAMVALKNPDVPWTNGLPSHRERNFRFAPFSLSAWLERCWHQVT